MKVLTLLLKNLFNILRRRKKALQEMYRVLKPHGRLVMSDP
jgi:ubiquinone/menaquinone biosynthesis C-methylase UbiE